MPSSACDWSSDVCSSDRSEEHTSELQSRSDLVCRLLLEKKKNLCRLSDTPPVRLTQRPPDLSHPRHGPRPLICRGPPLSAANRRSAPRGAPSRTRVSCLS